MDEQRQTNKTEQRIETGQQIQTIQLESLLCTLGNAQTKDSLSRGKVLAGEELTQSGDLKK